MSCENICLSGETESDQWVMDGPLLAMIASVDRSRSPSVCLSTVQLMHAYKRTVINMASSRCIVAVLSWSTGTRWAERECSWYLCVHIRSCGGPRMGPKQFVKRLFIIKDFLKYCTSIGCLLLVFFPMSKINNHMFYIVLKSTELLQCRLL